MTFKILKSSHTDQFYIGNSLIYTREEKIVSHNSNNFVLKNIQTLSVLMFVLDQAGHNYGKPLRKGKLSRMTTIAWRESKLGRGFSSVSSHKVKTKKTPNRPINSYNKPPLKPTQG